MTNPRRQVRLAAASAVLCVVAIVLGGCDGSTEKTPIPSGFSLQTYVDKAGQAHRYAIFVPYHRVPGGELPVVMFLNGYGENGNDGVTQISKNLGPDIWERRDHFPFLTVVSQCREEGTWKVGGDDANRALEILDKVIREFNADANRVYLFGASTGGVGAWEMGSAYGDRFAAIVPLCGIGGDSVKLAKSRMPVWHFINAGDYADLVEKSRDKRVELLAAGLSPRFTEFTQDGHDCWTAAFAMPELYRWLLQQRRTDNQASGLFEYYPAFRVIAEWRQGSADGWYVKDDEILVSRLDRGDARLISPPLGLPADFHGEFWLDENSTIVIEVSTAASAAKDGARFIIKPPLAGTGGVHRLADKGGPISLSASSQQSLRVEAWNDVRFRFADGKATMDLNGWEAGECLLNSNGLPPKPVQIVIVGPNGSEVRWRDLRLRTAPESDDQSPRSNP